jgi:hypothetical protein
VLIAQDQPYIEAFSRAEAGEWLLLEASGLDRSIELQSIGVSLALAAVYEKVSFDNEGGESLTGRLSDPAGNNL